MTSKPLAALPVASALTGAELLYAVQSGGDVQTSPAQVATYLTSLGSPAVIRVWDYLSAAEQADVSSWGGATNVTAAINSAIAALPSTGGALIFDPGRWVTSGSHIISVPCTVVGYGKSILSQPGAPATGVTQIECGVDVVDVFTFGTTGRIADLGIVDTIVATRTSGDAVVVFSGDQLQRVDMTDCLIYGFWNGYNGRVTNSCKVTGNDIECSLNFGVVVDNEVNADAGDNIVANNNIYPGFTGKTAQGAIRVRNGGNHIEANAVVKNAGTVTYGILADIRTGTGQLFVGGNKIESVAAEPLKISYPGGVPQTFNYVNIFDNVLSTTSATAGAIDIDAVGYYNIAGNVLAGAGPYAIVNSATCAAGAISPNVNAGFTEPYNSTLILSNSTKVYWDANPLYIGTLATGVRLDASAGGLSVATASSNAATDLTAGFFFVQGSNSGRPSDTTFSATKGYFSGLSGNKVVFNSNGANYGVVGVDVGGDRWYFGASANGLSGTLTNTALSWTQNGNVVVGSSAIATSASDGFFYVDTCAGTPTGTPTAYTGRAPMVYDSTNNVFYIYNSSAAAWKAH